MFRNAFAFSHFFETGLKGNSRRGFSSLSYVRDEKGILAHSGLPSASKLRGMETPELDEPPHS